MRTLPFLVSPLVAVMSLAVFAASGHADDKDARRSITVSATGSVTAAPDIAAINSGVTTEAATARAALDKNSAVMKKLIAGLKEGGIDAKDIQTSSFRIEPRYTRAHEGQASVIDGYRVINQVQVTVREIDNLGEILDSLSTLGANQMSGLSFEVSKAETLLDEARKDAVANALRRAKLFADAAGAEVGEVLQITESATGGGPRPMAMARTAMAEAVPIERGTELLQANVTITWELK